MEFKKKHQHKDRLPVYEIMINDTDETGIRFISLVDDPAIEIKGMYFAKKYKYYDRPPVHGNCKCTIDSDGNWILDSEACTYCFQKKDKYDRSQQRIKDRNRRKEDKKDKGNSARPGNSSFERDEYDEFESDYSEMEFSTVDEKQIIVAPALIPDKLIYRQDETGEYLVTFTAPTIAKMVEKFNRSNNNKSINVDHSNQMVNAFVVENWIIENSVYDKSRFYNFDLPVGTWMVMVKILDTEFWNDQVKGEGKFGFSIEGLLGQRIIEMSKEIEQDYNTDLTQFIDDLTEDELKDILKDLL
ncbi:MAG: hypothetical protein EOO06_00365 [Chitinophagaceae bacterium]|nr:MAG: hypothetical protein EOO06_00365 [Chitinophagaceae bacterium]